jgi:hypothetical protein
VLAPRRKALDSHQIDDEHWTGFAPLIVLAVTQLT